MAKEKLVAKVRFDDGTKKTGNGVSSADYNIGEAYMGSDSKEIAALKKKGLLCSEAELKASAEVLDEKDKVIKALEAKIAEGAEALKAAEQTIEALSKEIEGMKEPKK